MITAESRDTTEVWLLIAADATARRIRCSSSRGGAASSTGIDHARPTTTLYLVTDDRRRGVHADAGTARAPGRDGWEPVELPGDRARQGRTRGSLRCDVLADHLRADGPARTASSCS